MIRNGLSPDELDRLIAVREAIHRHPELAFQEKLTAQKIESFLDDLKLIHRRVAGTGVIADIGGQPGPIVALRADMDALPVQENTGLSYQSEVPGVMHACGHDMHTTWLLGAAMMLKRSQFQGTIRLVFQPAEEVVKGAAAVLESGELDGVSAIFGAHVDRNFPIGQVVVQPGSISAASDRFAIVLNGKSAHGARPHQGRDAIVAAGHLIAAIQSIASRFTDPADPVVVTIGSISGGTAPNIIADRVAMAGTVRTLRGEARDEVERHFARIVSGMETLFDITIDLHWTRGVPPIENRSPQIDWVAMAVDDIVGKENRVVLPRANMAAEDFAVYLQKIPGAFVRIGVCESAGNPVPAHSPHFYVDHSAISIGASILAQIGIVACRAL